MSEIKLTPKFVESMIVSSKQKGLDIFPVYKAEIDSLDHQEWEDFLFSENANSLLLPLIEKYDVILLDIPPLLTNEQAVTLMTLADSVILFLRWDNTPIQTVSNVSILLSDENIILSNIVATRVYQNNRV